MAREKHEDLDRRLAQVERNQQRLSRELSQVRSELRALGIDVPELNPEGRTKLSPQARLSLLQRAAANARAAKDIGEGKGAVRDAETAMRLRNEARALLEQADEFEENEEEAP